MTPQEYRSFRKLSRAKFAEELRITVEALRRHELPPGHKARLTPNQETMRRYYEVTDGLVTPNDFYDLPAEGGAPPDSPAPAEAGPAVAVDLVAAAGSGDGAALRIDLGAAVRPDGEEGR